jgi:hypothetical protein
MEADTHPQQRIGVSKIVIEPAGPEKSIGIISSAFLKDPTDPQWKGTPEFEHCTTWRLFGDVISASSQLTADLSTTPITLTNG